MSSESAAARFIRWEPEQIRCIAFDAVGTLIHPEPAVGEVYFEVAQRHGSRLGAADITARFKSAFRATERNDIHGPDGDVSGLQTSEKREFERWREIVSRVMDDVTDPQGAFEELYAHFARPESWRCFDDTAEALERLAAEGYDLAIASNFDHRLESVCAGLNELRPIRRLAISSKIGHRKPSPRFFKALSAMTECAPAQLLMVGDDWENDVVGANAAGVPAVFLNRSACSKPGEIRTLRELCLAR